MLQILSGPCYMNQEKLEQKYPLYQGWDDFLTHSPHLHELPYPSQQDYFQKTLIDQGEIYHLSSVRYHKNHNCPLLNYIFFSDVQKLLRQDDQDRVSLSACHV